MLGIVELCNTRLYAALPCSALPRHDAAKPRAHRFAAGSQGRGVARPPRGPRQAAGLGLQGGFAATHGRGHVPTTINIEMLMHNFAHNWASGA